MKRVVIDYENNAEEWWDIARADERAPVAIRPLLYGTDLDELEVPDQVADQIMRWASAIPGFTDGPEHARTALFLLDA